MSITHDHGDIVFLCDGNLCHRSIATETSNFDSALNLLKRRKWTARKVSGVWQHFCPDEPEVKSR